MTDWTPADVGETFWELHMMVDCVRSHHPKCRKLNALQAAFEAILADDANLWLFNHGPGQGGTNDQD